ncbi:HAD family hydrolase [Candidatus Woesearchaeota archaeon]|nr:HAD family hydrolase [Candidatus Woesearchaeota archaeon]
MKTIIFDLDDTLYVSRSLRKRRENAIVRFLGEKAKEYYDLKTKFNTIAALEKLGISKETFYKLMESVKITLKSDFRLRRILKRLKKDFKLIVLSNSSSLCVIETLKQLGILDLIDQFYGGDCFSKTKPDKQFFSIVKKGDICVGNNFKKDLLIPKRKGAVTVLIGNKGDARFKISSIYEIEHLISNKYLNQ